MTRADKIRNMTDEELVEFAFENDIDNCFPFCKDKRECEGDIDKDTMRQMCKECMIEWIREEAE